MKKTNITTFLIIITAIMCGALHSQAQTKEAYAVKNDSTLTFYYDTHRTSRNGIKYDMPAASDDAPVWTGSGMCYNTDIKRAVFDVSFKEFRLTSTYDWFAYCSTLKEIIGIEYLNTEDVSDMSKMFSGCFSLISIDLSNFNTKKVTDMSEMFYCCEALTSLDVSSFNTENVTSMYGMFNSCNALKALNLSNFNTGKVTNMNAMFYCCYSLKELNLSNFNTENVTAMDGMFYRCNTLTTLNLSNFNTEKVTNTESMFYDCESLTSLNLSKFNINKARGMGHMFERCKELTTIFCDYTWICETSAEMFGSCTKLIGTVPFDDNYTDVSMANPDKGYFTKVYKQAYAVEEGTILTFYYDTKQSYRTGTTYSIPTSSDEKPAWAGTTNKKNTVITKAVFDESFKTLCLTGTYSWFAYCTALKEIVGMEYLNTENVSDMSEMFSDCSSLTSINLSEFNTGKTTNMNSMFKNCKNINTIYCNDTWICNKSEMMFSGCTKLVGAVPYNASNIDITMANPNNGYFTKTRQAYAVEDGSTLTFYYDTRRASRSGTIYEMPEKSNIKPAWTGTSENCNSRINKAVFDKSFKDFRLSSTFYWFAWCLTLTEIVGMENLNTEDVTNMRKMFLNCSKLNSLDLSNFNTKKVTDMSEMFNHCSRLNSLDLSNFNTENVNDMNKMFLYCSSLTSINLSSLNTANVSDMSYMFCGCGALKSLDLSTFRTEKVNNICGMFIDCQSLTSLDLSKFNTEKVTNMRYLFKNCKFLKSLDISNFNTEKVVDMSAIFCNCMSLTSLNISNFNTENVIDMSSMFSNCRSLKSLDISKLNTHKVIYMDAIFSDCSSLTSLDLSNFKTDNVIDMGGMFLNCKSITSLDLSKFNTQKVTEMRNMFSKCLSLISLNLSNLNTETLTNTFGMFSECKSLTSLDLSSFNTHKVTDMEGMFYECNALTTIYCNDTWKCELSSNMFNGCTKLVGAIPYDENKTDATMANPNTGYFTSNAPSGVETGTGENVTITEIYTTNGQRIPEPQRGLNILRMSNGTTRKLLKK